MIGGESKTDVYADRGTLKQACHRLVLELSRAHQEGKAATLGHPSRVGQGVSRRGSFCSFQRFTQLLQLEMFIWPSMESNGQGSYCWLRMSLLFRKQNIDWI